MIVFDLKCPDDHVFEGWFADSATFDQQVEAGEVTCPYCGSPDVEKALMAPNVATRSSAAKGEETSPSTDMVSVANRRKRPARSWP